MYIHLVKVKKYIDFEIIMQGKKCFLLIDLHKKLKTGNNNITAAEFSCNFYYSF